MGFSWCYFINQKLCQFEPTLKPESCPFFSFQPFFIPGVQEYLNKILTTVTGPNKPKTSGKLPRIANLQSPASGQENPATLQVFLNHRNKKINNKDERIFFWERIRIQILIVNLKFFKSEYYSRFEKRFKSLKRFEYSNNIRIQKISDLKLIFGSKFVPKKRFVHL